MRIEPTEKSHGIGTASPAHPDGAAPSRASAGSDHVELSTLSRAAAGLSPDRLAEIQSSVHSGTYAVDPADVSQNIVDFYLIQLQ